MSVRPKYKTKQRKTVQACLETLPGVHVTAGELYEKLKQEGISVGQTTVYRQLESLVDEGIVNKYFVDDNSPACFEYIGEDGRKGPDECFHCKCEKCGRSFTECVRTVSGQKKIRREKAAINGGSEIAKHNKRAAACILGILLLFAVLFSSLTIAAEAEHDCKGEGCPICACIQQCENFLHQIGTGTAAAAAIALPIMALYICIIPVSYGTVQKTLVSQKVRLND